MELNHIIYVPCLRWKQGEYQAILKLADKTKEKIVPLIEVPELGWDFEEEKAKRSIDQLLPSFIKRIYDKWDALSCFIDVMKHISSFEKMADGTHPITYVFDALRKKQCLAVPVVVLTMDEACITAVKREIKEDGRGVCLRIPIEQAANSKIKENIDVMLSKLLVQADQCDLILDLAAPNYIPVEGFVKVINDIISKTPYLNRWRTFTILGSSFPESMASIKREMEIIPRYEWQLYKQLVVSLAKSKLRVPNYGDYAIAHPKILQLDMRYIKPYATIRYAIEDYWCIVKGKIFRENRGQYYELSKKLVASEYYYGDDFSYGDEFIKKCANGKISKWTLTTWRLVGTNHHIEVVVRDIANYFDSLKSI